MAAWGFWSGLLVRLPALGAYFLGLIIGIALAIRRRDAASWLALIGFGLLWAANGGSWLMTALPIWLATRGAISLAEFFTCLNFVFSLLSAVGALCLALALWIGLSNSSHA